MTFGKLLTQYIASLGARPSKAKYSQLQRQFFCTPDWHEREASAITRYDLLLLKQQLAATPAHANKVLGLVKQAYVWGGNTIDPQARRPIYDGPNPADTIRGFTCKSREVLMDHTQLRLIVNSLDFLDAKYRAFFTLRLLAPGRIKELCDMRWEHVDLVTGKWLKPTTKNGRQHIVPLPVQAIEALETFRSACPPPADSPGYVFKGACGRAILPESVRKSWNRFRLDLHMEGIWLLDFRRTLASYLYTVVKADDMLVKAMLNHYDGRPSAVYTRLSFDFLTPIMQRYADWVWLFKEEVSHANTMDLFPAVHHDSPGIRANLSLQ